MRNALGVLIVASLFGCKSSSDTADSGAHHAPAGDGGPHSTTDAGSEPDGHLDAAVDRDADLDLDAALDSGSDASDSSARPPLCDPERQGTGLRWGDPPGGLARIPLDLLCDDACARSQADLFANLTCDEFDDAGVDPNDSDDAGDSDAGRPSWVRSEGCGTVQYTTVPPAWPRYYNFDSTTGDLIGAIQVDDIARDLGDWPCESAAWIAGTVRLTACSGEVISFCH